jgi:tryptophan-rich sensory protein
MPATLTTPSARCCPHPADPTLTKWGGIGAIVIAVVCVQLVGWLLAAGSAGEWYAALSKPSWTPADRVYGPVWAVMYVLSAVAAALVWAELDRVDVCGALGLFGVQLAANLAWAVFFFGFRSPLLGLIDLAALWGAVIATTVEFWSIRRAAGALLVPYLLWTTYALVLNTAITLRNPG